MGELATARITVTPVARFSPVLVIIFVFSRFSLPLGALVYFFCVFCSPAYLSYVARQQAK